MLQPMQPTMLSIDHLSKRFGSFTAVRDVNFSVRKGEILGLLGPNGAGKTTTIAMIMGITLPTSGTIRMFGLDFSSHREEILKRMNFSSAYVRAPWRLTVWEHVYVFALLYEVPDAKRRVDELLDAFAIAPLKRTLIGDLSSGNIARLNLAKAFINRPDLVLLDEPTSSLDPDIADRVRDFIKTSQETYHTTMILTSHNMAEIEELCDRVIFMSHGRIVEEDTPESLAKKIRTTRVRLMMRDGQKRTAAYCVKRGLSYTADNRFVTITIPEKDIAGLLSDLAGVGADYREISIDKPSLEDYFIGEARDETH